MIHYSLRRRLLLWLLMATAMLGVVALFDTWREALRTAQSVSDRVLIGSALAIAERVSVDQSGGLEVDIPHSSLEMLSSTAQDRVFYRVDGPVGYFLTGYPDLPVADAKSGSVTFSDGTYRDVGIRSATLTKVVSTGAISIPFSVTVAESTRARSALARAILVRSALRLGGLIFGVGIVVWIAVTLALRPLTRLGDAISERTPDDLRALTLETPAELEPLIVAINSFMARLDMALAALRNFTGNASHQIRTPLAVVRTQLELITRTAHPEESASAHQKARTALERAERVLAQLLVLARVDSSSPASLLQSVNATTIAKEVTTELVSSALANDIDLGFEGNSPCTVRADPILLAELLKNLVSNAINYAGRGAVVTVRVRHDASQITLEVEDDGPGMTEEHKNAVANSRFRRARPAPVLTNGSSGGTGLGLSIATEIAQLFKAELSLHDREAGSGLLVRISFAAIDIGVARPY